jgi:hypothetical protein
MIRESLLAFTMLAGANEADAFSTQHVVSARGWEQSNPWMYGRHAERIVPVKLAVAAAETAVFIEMRRHKKTKKLAWVLVASIVAGNLYYAYKNEQLAGRLRSGGGR